MTRFDGSLWISVRTASGNAATKPAAGSCPPYNLEILPADNTLPERLRITLAVAGFSREDLDVTVEDGALHVHGDRPNDDHRDYLHRGLASRRFRKTFALVNGVEVREAVLHNDLLAIELERLRQERRSVKVSIKSSC
jgi:HSP20 family molecular chaperone IbpA